MDVLVTKLALDAGKSVLTALARYAAAQAYRRYSGSSSNSSSDVGGTSRSGGNSSLTHGRHQHVHDRERAVALRAAHRLELLSGPLGAISTLAATGE
jgi:hypothetical protein